MNIRIIPRAILRLTVILLSLLGLNQAAADGYNAASCQIPFAPTSRVITMPVSLSVASDTPVGTVIYQSPQYSIGVGVNNAGSGGGWCLAYLAGTIVASLTGSPVGGSVFNTSVPGIGIQFIDINTSKAVPLQPATSGSWPLSKIEVKSGSQGFTGYFVVKLIVVGRVGSGSFQWPSGNILNYYLSDDTFTLENQVLAGSVSIAGTTNVIAPACKVTNQSTTVQLPVARASQFVGVGTTQGRTPFNIALTCDAGVKVSYRVDSSNQVNNILSNNTGNGNAIGVGVQLLDGNYAPLKLATKVLATTTSSGNQAVNIPLSAQYFQTSASVTGGLVQASATLTMYYE